MIKRIVISAVAFVLLCTANVYAANNTNTRHTTVFSDYYFSDFYVIKTDGTLYSVPFIKKDDGYESELSLSEMIPVKVVENVLSVSADCVLTEDGTVWEWNEENSDYSMLTDNVRNISSFSAELIVKNDGSLWGKGGNGLGQLAQGEMDKSLEQQINDALKWRNETKCSPSHYDELVKIMDDVKSAVTDWSVSTVLKNDGTVWTFGGDQGGGALGIGGKWLVNNEPTKILSDVEEVFVSNESGFAIDNNDTLWRWGSNYLGYTGGSESDKLTPVPYIENVKYATNMPGYNMIIKTDSSLWIYGDTDSDNGNIGYTSLNAPVKIAENVACVTGLPQENFDNDRILVLKENGDLTLFAVPLYEDRMPYEIGKIMGNVRLPDETNININFTDMSDKPEEMKKAINSLAKAGIVSGISDTEFATDKTLTRAEAAALLLRVSAKADEEGNGGFEDVSDDVWYYHAAGASKKYGIVKGFEDNTFRGDEAVSKLQMVSLAARVLRSESNFINEETDAVTYSEIPNWAVGDVSLAKQDKSIQ